MKKKNFRSFLSILDIGCKERKKPSDASVPLNRNQWCAGVDEGGGERVRSAQWWRRRARRTAMKRKKFRQPSTTTLFSNHDRFPSRRVSKTFFYVRCNKLVFNSFFWELTLKPVWHFSRNFEYKRYLWSVFQIRIRKFLGLPDPESYFFVLNRILQSTRKNLVLTSYQCCGSGSGIRCLFDPWTRKSFFRIPDPNPIFCRA